MHHFFWLGSAGIPWELKTTIKDLPFGGFSFFHEKIDKAMRSLNDSTATLRFLGIGTLAIRRMNFRPQPHKQQQLFQYRPPNPWAAGRGLQEESPSKGLPLSCTTLLWHQPGSRFDLVPEDNIPFIP